MYEPNSEILSTNKTRECVKRSRMFLFLGWEISSSFMLDQIRRQSKSITFKETNIIFELQGIGFNIDTKTRAIPSVALESNNRTLIRSKTPTKEM